MGDHPQTTQGQGPRKKAAPRAGVQSELTAGGPVVDAGREKGPAVSAAEPQVEVARAPTVAGQPVRELAALIIPAVFLVTQGDGTHEITRCYYLNGKYTISVGERSRLGPFECLGADLGADGRLTITFSRGYVVTAPSDRVQVTHRV